MNRKTVAVIGARAEDVLCILTKHFAALPPFAGKYCVGILAPLACGAARAIAAVMGPAVSKVIKLGCRS